MTTASDELLRRWDEAAARGAIRTSADGAQWRVVPGELGVVVTFNPLHRANKRPVAVELTATARSDPPATVTAFNFTLVRPVEFLCGLSATATVPVELSIEEMDERLPVHGVLVNVSPLMRGHLLCVFDMCALHAQCVTLEMLRLAEGCGRLVTRASFALGFNSVGAWSSVNHCHFQGYWMDEVAQCVGEAACSQFPVATQEREELFQVGVGGSQVSVSQPVHWPMRCFAIEQAASTNASGPDAVVHVTWELIRLLQARNIPHNMLLVWRPRLCAFVFPRQQQYENGIGLFSTDDSPHQLRFAVAEVAGFVVAGSQSVFNHFSQQIYQHIMEHEISLNEPSFSAVALALRNAL